MNVLRTPDERFENLAGYTFTPHYVDVNGMRMHFVEEGSGDPILCIHGEPSWSYLYRKMIPILTKVGQVIAPDLIGFGRSDKPAERSDYTYQMHYSALEQFLLTLDLRRVTLVCQDWGGLLGLPLALNHADRFSRLVIMNTGLPTGEETPTPGFLAWRNAAAGMKDMDVGRVIQSGCVTKLAPEVMDGYNAPFPDLTYKSGAHEFPMLVPISTDSEGSPFLRTAREKIKTWNKPALIMFSDSDPVTRGGDRGFRKNIPSAAQEPEKVITGAGHFLQEDKGEEIAEEIVRFIERRPV